jgi:8-oxo-dGTP pyrophosphatase MutT (NUDIX family)
MDGEMGRKWPLFEFEILARGLYCPDQLDIIYDPSLRMPINPSIQAWMDTLWEQKLAIAQIQKIPLFDAPLFRFIEAESKSDGTLHLVLGNTGYKEYVTTRVPEVAQGRKREELGNALSVCSVVETSDGYILLDKRQGVDVYVGRYHVIGGFFERDLDSTGFQEPDPFGAICREIREETGIQQSDINEQFCLGVVYDTATPHAEMCFLTRLTIPLAEVNRRVPEEDEIKKLEVLKVTKESLREFLLKNHGNISATGEPNLLLYGGVRFGERWLEEMMGYLNETSPSSHVSHVPHFD